jgi:hypothetical protein
LSDSLKFEGAGGMFRIVILALVAVQGSENDFGLSFAILLFHT